MSARRRVLVTGGNGFVLAAAARALLEADPDAEVTILDRSPLDPVVLEFVGAGAERLSSVVADVTVPESLPDLDVSHVVHGATVTMSPSLEREHARSFLDVNVGGTVNMLEWARRREVVRFVQISSGGVYGPPTPWREPGLQDEAGPFNPESLYSVSKLSAELTARRYGRVFGFDVSVVRPTVVFGPMERPTPSRKHMSLAYRCVRATIEERPLRVSPRTLAAGLDVISSEEVGAAIAAVSFAEQLESDAFNAAGGGRTPIPELLATFEAVLPRFEWTTDSEPYDLDLDPKERLSQHLGTSTARLERETDWRRRPLAEQIRSYVEWVLADPGTRCPPS